jgi:hypothetical protein
MYDEKDFYNLNKVILLKRFGVIPLVYFLVMIFVFTVLNANSPYSSSASPLFRNLIGIVLFILILIIIGPIVLKTVARRNFKSNKEFQSAVDFIITEDGLSGHSIIGDFQRDWDYFSKFVESKDAFVLFLSNNTVNYLPKRCFFNENDINITRIIFKNKVKSKSRKYLK